MTKTYEIGPFQLDPEAGVLTYAGVAVGLGSRGVAVLSALVERADEYVSKRSIMDAAWPGVIVEESNLAVQISAIRRVLAREPGGEHWIETLARRGYRFVGNVTVTGDSLPRGGGSLMQRSNLPAPLTSFVGRQRELVEIKRLLAGKRLLTLVGVGGIGKTRLALEVAVEMVDAYRDGVWFVDLAPLVDPTLVPSSVAQALGVSESAGTPLIDTLCSQVKSRQLLLLLDNCEHVLDACARLAEVMLLAAAGVTIIATSREPLHVPGEQTYPLPTLSLPDPMADAENVARSEAVQLFVERAQRQRPGFSLTIERATAVAQLCIHLDGIPLLLELAAARVRSLTIEEINARLNDRFKLLTGGARTALPRQQTLRAMLDWSYDLLREGEKALLCRVSVFSGGWTLKAAKQVCIREAVEDGAALDLLASLADKSLVLTEERKGATRYRILETVHQYARDRLRESGEEAQWQRRHFAYFLAVAEEAEPQLTSASQQACLDRLETEHDNLRCALVWSCAVGGDAAGGLRLAGALWRFWYVRGYASEGRDWLRGLLATAPEERGAAARAKALNAAGALAWVQSDDKAAGMLFEQSLAIRRKLGDRQGIASSLGNLGAVALDHGNSPTATALYEESLAIQRELGDRWGIASSLNNLGNLSYDQSDFPAARALYEESLAIRRKLGDRWGIATSLNNLGLLAREQDDYPAARALSEESLAIQRELGDREGIALSLTNLGSVASAQGDDAAARTLFKQSLVIQHELGDRRSMARSLEGLAYAECGLDAYDRAARLWGAAERLREEIGVPLTPSDLRHYDRQLGAARAAMGDDAAFNLGWREGRDQSLEQAVKHALEDDDAKP